MSVRFLHVTANSRYKIIERYIAGGRLRSHLVKCYTLLSNSENFNFPKLLGPYLEFWSPDPYYVLGINS